MKILKYILLILFLFFIASTILVATLNPNYTVVRTKNIKVPKAALFTYVNDYKNWPEFGSWHTSDQSTKYNFFKNTVGPGANYSWIAKDGEGSIKTIFVQTNDSILQRMIYNGSDSKVYWTFKENNGITKVTWTNKGKMDFATKIFTTFTGGIENLIGNMYEKSLVNIEKNLMQQTNTFSIKIDGFEDKNIGYYLQKTINSKNENLANNIQIMIPNILKFVKNNKLTLNGKPFVKYNGTNDSLQITNFSVCVPIKDSLIISPQSEINFKTLLPFRALKTTLKGDYVHKQDAINQANTEIIANNLIRKIDAPIIEFYILSKFQEKNASRWITEIYIPVQSKNPVKKFYKPKKVLTDSTTSAAADIEKVNPISN